MGFGAAQTITDCATAGSRATEPAQYRRRLLLHYGVLFILLAAYAAQVFTPLRLHPDAVALLTLADSVAHGGEYVYPPGLTVQPPGYPALVAGFLRIGWNRVWVLIALNFLFLGAGLYAARYILRKQGRYDDVSILKICILTLLSFVVVKHFAIPLTDICFFGAAMGAAALMESALELKPGPKLFRRLLASWIFLAVALALRRIGFALIPALVWTIVAHPHAGECLRRFSLGAKIVAASMAAIAGAITLWIGSKTATLIDWHIVRTGHSVIEFERQVIDFRFSELGEMAFNMPRVSFPAAVQNVLPFVGVAVFGCVLAGGILKRRFGPTEAFILSYIAILFLWPFYDPRFWLPVIPLLIAYAGLAVRRLVDRYPLLRTATAVYPAAFAIVGATMLASSTAMTFAGANFPNVYRDGLYGPTYCAVYRSCDGPPNQGTVDKFALHVLQTFK